MLRFRLLLGTFLLLPHVLLADWFPKVNFRSLLQSTTTTNNNPTVSNRTFDLNCTWSDEIFCYLDYFEHLPESEIKGFYRADEGCRSVSNQTLCESDSDCKWTKLVGSDAHGCFATILEEDLRLCSFNSTPPSGSMCSVWRAMDLCQRIKPKNAKTCLQQRRQNGRIRCQWEDGRCFLDVKSLIQLEFVNNVGDADFVSKLHDHCYNSTRREDCEADHGIE